MEIGSFIEIQFPGGFEYYHGKGVARLNSGRAAIYHAIRVLGCTTVWLPYYQCDTVRDFLERKGIRIHYYHIDKNFRPVDIRQKKGEAVVLVNYYGVFSKSIMADHASGLANIIYDNSQAFFSSPNNESLNVYSARKFVGVPDGAYVVGKNAESGVDLYPQGYSSDTSLFLLQRHEYGCEGKSYNSRMLNEQRIDTENISRMSKLTHDILDGTDYSFIAKKRKENFRYATELFSRINKLDLSKFIDGDCIPMVYPLVIEDDQVLPRLLKGKHFQGHWWSYLIKEVPTDSFEYWLSRYMIPITIDQRYGKDELKAVSDIVSCQNT